MSTTSRAKYYYAALKDNRPIEDKQDRQTIVQSLDTKGIILKRGDMVLDSAVRCTPRDTENPGTDNGYRHQGMYIFNGQKLIHLDDEPDDYGSIPEEFQVIKEFPPMYWSYILNHNSYIPFNVAEQVGTIHVDNIQQFIRKDGDGSHLVLQLQDNQGQIYMIVDMDERHPTTERINQFIQEIQKERYFQTLLLDSKTQRPFLDPVSLPDEFSYEYCLLHSKDNI